jgi:hypothetical protein
LQVAVNPRKAYPELAEGRQSIPQTFGNALSTGWIPAFAGMTGVSYKDAASNDTTARALQRLTSLLSIL